MNRWLVIIALLGAASAATVAGEPAAPDCAAETGRLQLELTLDRSWKGRETEVRRQLQTEAPDARIHIVVYPSTAPRNLGIGRCVSAEIGRMALRRARGFNQAVEALVMQDLLPHHWIGIGVIALPEKAWIPVTAADLERLADPKLSTQEFQALYRQMATLTDIPGAYGMPAVPIPPAGESNR